MIGRTLTPPSCVSRPGAYCFVPVVNRCGEGQRLLPYDGRRVPPRRGGREQSCDVAAVDSVEPAGDLVDVAKGVHGHDVEDVAGLDGHLVDAPQHLAGARLERLVPDDADPTRPG
jgi:hypothetical protein